MVGQMVSCLEGAGVTEVCGMGGGFMPLALWAVGGGEVDLLPHDLVSRLWVPVVSVHTTATVIRYRPYECP